MLDGKKNLKINSGLALLLNDRDGILDTYEGITINSGAVVVSAGINLKLSAKGAKINCGDMKVTDIKGDIIQLDSGAVIDGTADFKNLFVLVKDDLLVTKEGVEKLSDAEGLIALGKIFYPQSSNVAAMIKISGEKRAYPDNAHVILGNHKLGDLLAGYYGNNKQIWVSGRLTALERNDLEKVKSAGLNITCAKFFSYQSLNDEFGNLINCSDRILVPDGHEITGKIKAGELALHGPQLYVDGSFLMDENDIPALEEIQSIIVKGKASLPAGAVKIFKGKGKADEYFVYEGRLVDIKGFEQFSHSRLDASNKKKEIITLLVNGCILFDEDVTAEDVECIASLSYNGSVFAPGSVKEVLVSRIKTGNGFMGDPAKIAELTGKTVKELLEKATGDPNETILNLGTYILA